MPMKTVHILQMPQNVHLPYTDPKKADELHNKKMPTEKLVRSSLRNLLYLI